MSKVLVVGLGYVGLPLAARAAEVGHDVIGIDLDPRKINALQSKRTYIEDVSDEQLDALMGNGLQAALGWARNEVPPESVRDFDIAIIAVPTPLREGKPDLSYVKSAGEMLGQVLTEGSTVVLESTTYPGTTEGLLSEALERESGLTGGLEFHLGFSPERIDPGNKQYTLQNTPKLVSATTDEGLTVIQEFYNTIVDRTVPVSNPRVAEMTKLFENIQANVLIALANEMAELSHDLDIDVWEVLSAAMTKGHSVSYWTPGPGVGGHCLPIDPMYLAWQAQTMLGKPFRFAELADTINHERPVYTAARADQWLKRDGLDINGANVLVLGVAYKPNVGDMRESPAIEVVAALKDLGAHVTAVDPHVSVDAWSYSPMLSIDDLYLEIDNYAMVIVVTDHADFDWDKIAGSAHRLLDTRNAARSVTGNVEAL